MYKIADLLVREHKEPEYDYEKKFMIENIQDSERIEEVIEEVIEEIAGTIEESLNKEENETKLSKEKMKEKFIDYRKMKAKEEKYKHTVFIKMKPLKT